MGLLDSLLNPASVAIIGASPNPHVIRGQLLLLLRKNGFAGRIVPVNPSHAEIDGIPCFPTIAAGGGGAVALVAIPAAAVLPALEECAAAGVKHAVIISSGFAEDDAAPPDLQDRVAGLARRTGMRVLGPNAEGFHNEVARVSATFSPAVDRDADDNPTAVHARIGIVAQSGGMGFALYNRGRALGLSFSTVVSTGNEADLTAADLLAHMVGDPDTACILVFLEAIRDVAAFAAAARQAAAAGKPIVAIKVGRSAAGQIAAASHTASMAGWDAGYDAFFRHHGIVVASELDEACGVAMAPARMVTQRAGLAAAAAALDFPLAVKIQSAAIAHKTEVGGVRLGIADMPALKAAYDTVLANGARHRPGAAIDGVLLERMAAPGVEMIIGAIRDPTFGPIVSVGAGGVMTELFRDVAYALAPLDEAAAITLIGTLRSAKLLQGWRGAPAADMAALARLVSLVSRIAAAGQATISELELNPVIVHPAGPGSSDGGCTVVDALLAVSPAQIKGA